MNWLRLSKLTAQTKVCLRYEPSKATKLLVVAVLFLEIRERNVNIERDIEPKTYDDGICDIVRLRTRESRNFMKYGQVQKQLKSTEKCWISCGVSLTKHVAVEIVLHRIDPINS